MADERGMLVNAEGDETALQTVEGSQRLGARGPPPAHDLATCGGAQDREVAVRGAPPTEDAKRRRLADDADARADPDQDLRAQVEDLQRGSRALAMWSGHAITRAEMHGAARISELEETARARHAAEMTEVEEAAVAALRLQTGLA